MRARSQRRPARPAGREERRGKEPLRQRAELGQRAEREALHRAGAGRKAPGRATGAAAAVAVAPIRLYQRLLSPLVGARCRYYPSCSEYAVQAIRRYGILRGLLLAGWRLLRCNPWSAGGVDLVEDQTLFGRHGTRAGT